MSRWVDRRGTPITEGAKVAYNQSGDVVPGTVVATLPGHVKIRRDQLPSNNLVRRGVVVKPHISKVKRGGSILVLIAGSDES